MEVVVRERAESGLHEQRRDGVPVELPGCYAEYGIFVESLRASGVLARLGTYALARRAGSYEVVDLVLFLAAYFSSSSRSTPIADFAVASAQHGHELAGLGDRVRWLKQSSVSRALAAVDETLAREVGQLLLGMARRPLLESEACAAAGYRDGAGTAWRVFHWDTTVDTVRQRALPEGEGLPPGIRLGTDLSAPGYAGRKRGEGVFARSVVSDATSSIWVHMDLNCGSGSTTEQTQRAVADIVQYLDACPDELSRTVLVCDGVAGGWPQARQTLGGGLHVLTRVAEYDWLTKPAAVQRIERGSWRAVEDSRSGPKREALELGTREMYGRRVRVIASRFAVPSGKGTKKVGRGAGRTIDGWHYELFISSLPASGWAANDLVTLYYGRTAIENRFAAEDREYALSRVFSYTKPGQLLASAVALALWNHGVVTGLCSVSETLPSRPQRPRPTESDEPPAIDRTATEADQVETPSPGDREPSLDDAPDDDAPANQEVLRSLATEWCSRHPGWSFESPILRCPAGEALPQTRREQPHRTVVRFRASSHACANCALREQCAKRPPANFRKEVALIVPNDQIEAEPPLAPDTGPLAQPDPGPRPTHLPDAPILLPAELRKRARQLFRSVTIMVTAALVAPRDDDEPDVDDESDEPEIPAATTPESRQRRRLLIESRVAANARPQGATARVVVALTKPQSVQVQRLHDVLRSA